MEVAAVYILSLSRGGKCPFMRHFKKCFSIMCLVSIPVWSGVATAQRPVKKEEGMHKKKKNFFQQGKCCSINKTTEFTNISLLDLLQL